MLISLLLAVIQPSWASPWDIISKTEDCKYDVMIEAKEGENSIHAIYKGKIYILFPVGNYVYMAKNPIPLTYDSYNRRGNPESSPHFRYTKPGFASYRQSEIKITEDGEKVSCKLAPY